MIKNIVFDVGKVLVSFEPEMIFEKFHYDIATKEVLKSAIFMSPLWNENDRGVMTTQELIEGFIKNAPAYEKELRETFQNVGDSIELLPYTMDWIQALKEKGYHLYIISNYGEYTYEQTEHKLKFLEYMDGVIFSYKYKMIKPDLEIYEELLKEYHLKAEECVFIDDCMENVEAAKKAGFQGIHFLNYEDAKKKLEQMLED